MQATTWVRKESEKVAASPELLQKVSPVPVPDVRACFKRDEAQGVARYETRCADAVARVTTAATSASVSGGQDQQAGGAGARQEL